MSSATHCTDLVSLADHLGFASQNLFYLSALRDELYTKICIPKRNSSEFRELFIPCLELKGVQRAILRNILNREKPSENAYAYVEGKSVVLAAKKLSGRKGVLKIDIKDFFPSILEKRVFGLYRSIGFNNRVSYILTRLTTYKGKLCQGAPTSPAISNLICRSMDKDLSKLASGWDLSYMRYSDDLFFFGPSDFRHRVFKNYAIRVIQDHGFRINRKKTAYWRAGNPRFNLGLATHNREPALPRKERKRYRAAFFKASRNLKWARENSSRLSGMAEWYKAVYGANEIYDEYKKILENIKNIKIHDHYAI